MSQLRSRDRGQRGNALVEYVLLLTLVALAVVMGVSFFGQSISTEVGVVADEVGSLFGGGGSGPASGSAGGGQGTGHGHGAGNGGQNNGNGNGGQDNGTGKAK